MAALLLLSSCTSAPAALPPTGPATQSSPTSEPVPTGTADPHDARRLHLFVDARWIAAGRCTPASVSVRRGRLRVRLEWRIAGGAWSPWPAGPERRLHRGIAALPACPGWNSGPVEIRAVAPGARPSAPAHVHVRPEPWMRDLEAVIGDRPLSVSVITEGAFVYGHDAGVRRTPASNEKVLLSMALLDRFGPRERIPTEAAIRGRLRGGVVDGDLYLVGNGDPEVGADDIHRLALTLRAAGLRRIGGSVVADRSTFVRDRGAPGWHPIALRYIGLPTALSFEANVDAGGFVFDPERRAAAALAAELRSIGIPSGGPPGAARTVPGGLRTVAEVWSDPLGQILRRQNVSSLNLEAETLSKMLATDVLRRPGSIAAGARVIETWANDLEAGVALHDASGLSYRNRVSTASMAALLDVARRRPWGRALFASLPASGEGTLGGRLAGLEVRAKTGTLIRDVSALSGYVRLRDGTWSSFSIMSALPKDEAVGLEDAIVRAIAANA